MTEERLDLISSMGCGYCQELIAEVRRHLLIQVEVTRINNDLLKETQSLRELLREARSELGWGEEGPAMDALLKRIDEILPQ